MRYITLLLSVYANIFIYFSIAIKMLFRNKDMYKKRDSLPNKERSRREGETQNQINLRLRTTFYIVFVNAFLHLMIIFISYIAPFTYV